MPLDVDIYFSVTEINGWKRCRVQHDFNSLNKLGLEPAVTLPAFALGTLVHHGIEFWNTNPLATKAEVLSYYGVKAWDALQAVLGYYSESTGGQAPTQVELKANLDASTLGRAMIANYYDYYVSKDLGPLPQGYSLVQAEQTVKIAIPNTEHCCNLTFTAQAQATSQATNVAPCTYCGPCDKCRYCLPVYRPDWQRAPHCLECTRLYGLEGTLDGILTHDKSGIVHVLENKTFSRHPSEDGLIMNEQFSRYLWIVTKLLTIDADKPPKLLYNGLWKREKLPDKRSMDDMFERVTISRTAAQLEACEQETAAIVMEMGSQYTPIIRTVPPIDGCNGLMGCNFKDLCNARFNQPDNYPVILRGRYTNRQRTPVWGDDAKDD